MKTLNQRAAEKSAVLLKNAGNLLPLDKNKYKICPRTCSCHSPGLVSWVSAREALTGKKVWTTKIIAREGYYEF